MQIAYNTSMRMLSDSMRWYSSHEMVEEKIHALRVRFHTA